VYELSTCFTKTLAAIDFSEDYILMYFFLDKKVPKSQGYRKKAKNFPSKLK